MKKFLVLFLSMAFLFACSSDDDEPQGEDPIVGTWVLVDASEPIDSQFCFDEESTITFNANNTGEGTFYLTAAQCAATDSPGNWSKSNGNYTMTIQALGNLPGTINFTSNNSFTFTSTLGVLTFDRQ